MSDTVLDRAAAREQQPPQPRWLQVAWRQYRLERRMFWRNPSAAFFNFALPMLFLALFGSIYSDQQADLEIIVPGIAGMAVMSTTFTAIAWNLTGLRESGILKRIRGTPMSPSAYIAGLAGHAVTNTALQLCIVVAAGSLVLDVGWPADPFSMAVFAALGAACFAALGTALSHVIPNFEAAPAYINAVFLPTVIISGVFYDADNAPAVLREIAEVLPLKHLIDGLSGAMVDGQGIGHNLVAVVVLLLWTGFGALFAVRGFRWESRRS
jgi:ABC-2 type transport system permease protein